jgi:hypothetical protein
VHTPGPWELKSTPYGIAIVGANGDHVCRPSGLNRYDGGVLLAAPDMLDTLRDAATELRECVDRLDDAEAYSIAADIDRLADTLDAAVRKASRS